MNEINTNKSGGLTAKKIGIAIAALIVMIILLPLLFKLVTWVVSTAIMLGILVFFAWTIYGILTHDSDDD